jgi:hypothetical protein
MTGPDYIVEIGGSRPATTGESGVGEGVTGPTGATGPGLRGRPWLAIHWRCCSVYSRVYRDASGASYHARCPRCGRPVHIAVGEGGTESRFFEAT